MLALFFKVVLRLFLLALLYLTGLYSILAVFFEILGLDNPSLIFSDSFTDTVDMDSSSSDEQAFYKRKSFWIGVVVTTIIVGIAIFIMYSPSTPKGDAPAQCESIVYNSVGVQTDALPSPVNLDVEAPRVIINYPTMNGIPSSSVDWSDLSNVSSGVYEVANSLHESAPSVITPTESELMSFARDRSLYEMFGDPSDPAYNHMNEFNY